MVKILLRLAVIATVAGTHTASGQGASWTTVDSCNGLSNLQIYSFAVSGSYLLPERMRILPIRG